jgi:translocator protein
MLKIATTLALSITLLVNALANILPINGLNTGEVSNLYPSLFTPAGITFSIWSILYLLQIGFVIFSWTTKDERVTKLLPAFILTCLLNAGWILLWHYLHPGLSVLVMLTMLSTLTYIFLKIQHASFNTKKEYVLVVLPFTLYFAWICVATIANVSAWLVSISWSGFGIAPEIWTVVMMIVATLLAFYISFRFHSPAFVIVVMWAIGGIYLRWNQKELIIANTAIILCIIMLGVFVYGVRKNFSVN